MIFHPLSVLHPRLTSAPSQEEPELSATCGRGVKSKKCKTFCGRAVRVFDFNQPARMALVHIGNLETYVALGGAHERSSSSSPFSLCGGIFCT